MLSKPKSDLDELVGELGGVADLDALDGDLDGVGLGLLALLDLVGPGDGLDVVNVGADQGLVELLGLLSLPAMSMRPSAAKLSAFSTALRSTVT